MGTGLNIGGGAESGEGSEGGTGSFITDGSADPIILAPLVRLGVVPVVECQGVPFEKFYTSRTFAYMCA